MIKTKASLELEVEGKMYTFLCDADAALQNVHTALSHFKTFIVGKMAETEKKEFTKPALVKPTPHEPEQQEPV